MGSPSIRGAVGVVVQAPADYWHSYRVRFPDHFEASFSRQELAVLSNYKEGGVIGSGAARRRPQHVGGVRSFQARDLSLRRRLAGIWPGDEESDTDRRGVYLPPADLHWSLYGVPEQLENPADGGDVLGDRRSSSSWRSRPIRTCWNAFTRRWSSRRRRWPRSCSTCDQSFLSKMVYQTYNGYVVSQFKKLQADLRNKGEVKWKHVMHLIRLLSAGITVLREGACPSTSAQTARQLLAIKRGEMPFEECESGGSNCTSEFDAAFETTQLPERPDYAAANALLLAGLAPIAWCRAEGLRGTTGLRESSNMSSSSLTRCSSSRSAARTSTAFPPPTRDYDLRGVHVLPTREVVGLKTGPETIEHSGVRRRPGDRPGDP